MDEHLRGPAKISSQTGEPNSAWNRPVSFPEWRAVLELEPFDAATRDRYARAIMAYLGRLRMLHERVSIAGARQYLE